MIRHEALKLFSRLRRGRTTRTLALYIAIGAAGVILYSAVLEGLLRIGLSPFPSYTVAYVTSIALLFTLNRQLTFRSLENPPHSQLLAFLTVAFVCYLVMIASEAVGLNVLRLTPLEAYWISIPVNGVVGYLGNRYVTFGPGLSAVLRGLRRRPD